MLTEQTTIKFRGLHQLWQFAQSIKVPNFEIRTKECLLVCNCSETDLLIMGKYGGELMEQMTEQNIGS